MFKFMKSPSLYGLKIWTLISNLTSALFEFLQKFERYVQSVVYIPLNRFYF